MDIISTGSNPLAPNVSEVLKALKPEDPVAAGSPWYVDLDRVRGGSPALILANIIQDADPGSYTHQLLTGFPGAGKSTELCALEARLKTLGYKAFRLDVDPFISKSEPLTPSDVLLAIGAALYDLDLGVSNFQEVVEWLWALIPSGVRIGGVDLTGKIGTDVKALKAEAGASLKLVFEHVPDLLAQVRKVIEQRDRNITTAVTRMVNLLQRENPGRVVLLVDSLEHAFSLSDRPADDAERLYHTMIDDNTLRLLPIHTVYTVSPLLLPHANQAARAYDGELLIVPSVSVVRPDGSENTEGVEELVDLLRKRVDFRLFENEGEDIRTAVRASGGYIRDLFRILRSAIQRRDPTHPFPLPTRLLELTIDRLASVTTGALTQENTAILSQVVEKPSKRLILKEDQHRDLYSLYREALMLRYLNGGCWDIAHPFVVQCLAPEVFERRVFPNGRKA